MDDTRVAVDHVIPRQLVYHDEVWNLVLAHQLCNLQKSDLLPSKAYVLQLIERNESLIKSNHPLKNKIIQALGTTPAKRRRRVFEIYKDAQEVIGYTWEGVRNYNPRTDPLFHYFVHNSK